MKLVVLNGSPRETGTVATLLRAVAEGAGQRHEIEWIDVCKLQFGQCRGCMNCRPDGECCLPEDDAHRVGRAVGDCDGLAVGTPTHWGNMSAPLKGLFDRLVPVFMGESRTGLPLARHRGKPALVVAACATPWPFNYLFAQSRGAVRAVREVLHYGGFRIRGVIVKPGTKANPAVAESLITRARSLGKKVWG